MKLTNKYRPKADAQLLRDLTQEAWDAHYAEHFPEAEQAEITGKIATLLERRFPPADMAVLAKYGQASSVTDVSVNIYHPERRRWDVYAHAKLALGVLCPQGRAHFSVGGPDTGGDHRLPAEFEPYFEKVRTARDTYNTEAMFRPQRVNGSYPTWEEIAEALPVTGKLIRQKAAMNGDNRKERQP